MQPALEAICSEERGDRRTPMAESKGTIPRDRVTPEVVYHRRREFLSDVGHVAHRLQRTSTEMSKVGPGIVC